MPNLAVGARLTGPVRRGLHPAAGGAGRRRGRTTPSKRWRWPRPSRRSPGSCPEGLDLPAGVTFLVGGTARAIDDRRGGRESYGLLPEGGCNQARHSTRASESAAGRRPAPGPGPGRRAMGVRPARRTSRASRPPRGQPHPPPSRTRLPRMSHGESFLADPEHPLRLPRPTASTSRRRRCRSLDPGRDRRPPRPGGGRRPGALRDALRCAWPRCRARPCSRWATGACRAPPGTTWSSCSHWRPTSTPPGATCATCSIECSELDRSIAMNIASVPCRCGQSCMVFGSGPAADGTSGISGPASSTTTSDALLSTAVTTSPVSASTGEQVA